MSEEVSMTEQTTAAATTEATTEVATAAAPATEFTLESLMAAAGELTARKTEQDKGNGDWPNCAFIPDGNHKGRFIIDPTNKIYFEVATHDYFRNAIICPDGDTGVPEGFVNELTDLNKELAESQFWKFGRKQNFMTYFWLVETDNPSDEWKPNTLYCLLGKRTFGDAYTRMITGLSKDAPEALLRILNPKVPGRLLQLTFQGGMDGTCSISPTMSEQLHEMPDLAKDHGYGPLNTAYVSPGFNQEKYDKILKKVKEEVAGRRAKTAAKNQATAIDEASKLEDEARGRGITLEALKAEKAGLGATAATTTQATATTTAAATTTEAVTTTAAAGTVAATTEVASGLSDTKVAEAAAAAEGGAAPTAGVAEKAVAGDDPWASFQNPK